jgi:DNA-directed RNA polymerase subunit RPC12/RpoP
MKLLASKLWLDYDRRVMCIACGETVERDDAREYDKYGDRWSRDSKEFEYLCTSCHREYCHQNRDELERLLIAADAGCTDRKTFLRQYCELVTDSNDHA